MPCDATFDVLRKYAAFSGRASRREFWTFVLVHTAIRLSLVWLFVYASEMFVVLLVLYQLAVMLPTLSLTVRRLHDSNRSGWLVVIYLFPRTAAGQVVESVLVCNVLNRMSELGRPESFAIGP